MKKQVLVAVITLLPALSFAKISDFDEIINENFKTQSELHSNIKGNIKEAREVEQKQAPQRERIVVVEESGVRYNSRTNDELLAFKKEKQSHRASEEKQFERLANEIHSEE